MPFALAPGISGLLAATGVATTAKKLGAIFYRYLHDLIAAENQIPILADPVGKQNKGLYLGWYWAAP